MFFTYILRSPFRINRGSPTHPVGDANLSAAVRRRASLEAPLAPGGRSLAANIAHKVLRMPIACGCGTPAAR